MIPGPGEEWKRGKEDIVEVRRQESRNGGVAWINAGRRESRWSVIQSAVRM